MSATSYDNSSDLLNLKGKVHPKSLLISNVKSDEIEKNVVDRFSISLNITGSQDTCIQSSETYDM